MSYARFIKDIERICLNYFTNVADKTTEKSINKNMTIIMNYYKLVMPDLFADESISVKVMFDEGNIGHIQLIMSPKLEEEYNKLKGR